MIKSRIIFLILGFLLFTSSAVAQNTITGVVKDAETGETLPGVNVYLANTTIGDAANERGSYKITTSETGTFELVFSFIGFKKKVTRIKITPGFSKTINASLEPDQYEMGELEVSGSNEEWKRNFERFQKEFIGQTDFAGQTEIENPYIIDFSERSGNLNATASQPIVVNNNALGYKIYLELDQFSWTNNSGGFYKIYPKFENMEPKDEDEREKWQSNREKTFKDSFRNFLKSLYHDELNKNKFTILNPSKIIPLSRAETKFEVMSRPNVSPDLLETLNGYRLTEALQVNYGETNNYKGTRGGNLTFQSDRSVLIPNTKSKTFFVGDQGNLLNPISLKIQGYWARFRLADQLPLNYSPE